MSEKRFIYIECRFNSKSGRKYTYKTTDKTISPGDLVTVDVNGERKAIDVVSVLPDFDESSAKFQIKEIVGKVLPPAGAAQKNALRQMPETDDLDDEGEL